MIEFDKQIAEAMVYEVPYSNDVSAELRELLCRYFVGLPWSKCKEQWGDDFLMRHWAAFSDETVLSVFDVIIEQYDIRSDKEIFKTILYDRFIEYAEEEILLLMLFSEKFPSVEDFFYKVTYDFLVWLDERNERALKRHTPRKGKHRRRRRKRERTVLGWLFDDLLEEEGMKCKAESKNELLIPASPEVIDDFRKMLVAQNITRKR